MVLFVPVHRGLVPDRNICEGIVHSASEEGHEQVVSGVTIKVCASEDPFEISQFLLLLLSGGKGRRHVQVVVNLDT